MYIWLMIALIVILTLMILNGLQIKSLGTDVDMQVLSWGV